MLVLNSYDIYRGDGLLYNIMRWLKWQIKKFVQTSYLFLAGKSKLYITEKCHM